MKKTIPLILAFSAGTFMVVQFFVPHRYIQALVEEVNRWASLIWCAALILGTLSLGRHLALKVRNKKEEWGYAIIALVSLVATLVIGFITGMEEGTLFMKLFKFVLAPLEATTFSLLAFYIASAAYRAFKAKTRESTLLLGAAFLVMVGRVPIGAYLWGGFGKIAEWIMKTPNLAGQRAILIGAALGIVSTALRIILGIEQGYMGGGE